MLKNVWNVENVLNVVEVALDSCRIWYFVRAKRKSKHNDEANYNRPYENIYGKVVMIKSVNCHLLDRSLRFSLLDAQSSFSLLKDSSVQCQETDFATSGFETGASISTAENAIKQRWTWVLRLSTFLSTIRSTGGALELLFWLAEPKNSVSNVDISIALLFSIPTFFTFAAYF